MFSNGNTLSAETNRQAANRASNFTKEWNTLADMQDSLSGESKIRLWNYMMGFAEGAYQLCEELHNSGFYDFSYEIEFFFKSFQDCIERVGEERTPYFRKYYYDVGGDRSFYGRKRLGINDFR